MKDRHLRFCVSLTGIEDGGLHVGNLMVLLTNVALARRYGYGLLVRYGWQWVDYFKYWGGRLPGLNVLRDNLDYFDIREDILVDEAIRLPHYIEDCLALSNMGLLEQDESVKIEANFDAYLAEYLPGLDPHCDFVDWLLDTYRRLGITSPLFVPYRNGLYPDRCQGILRTTATDGTILYCGVREAACNVLDDLCYDIAAVVRGLDIGTTYLPLEYALYWRLGRNPPLSCHLPEIRSRGEKMSKQSGNANGYRLLDLRERFDADDLARHLVGLCMDIPADLNTFADVCQHIEWAWLKPLAHIDIEETVFACQS